MLLNLFSRSITTGSNVSRLSLPPLDPWTFCQPRATLLHHKGRHRSDPSVPLTPSEQAVYLRLWRLTHADGKPRCAIRYEDLARLARVLVSTLKHVLKKLVHRGLVQVEWQSKRASLFTVHVRPLPPSPAIDFGLGPRLYDFFSDEDRSLFLSCKHALSPQDQKALEAEAGGNPLAADVLLFQRMFGPDRQRQYEALIERLTQNGRPF